MGIKLETKQLTKAELEVMQILWNKGEAFVSDILDDMPDPKPAYNTVSTIVRILEKKGVVSYKTFGKSHCYFPLVDKESYTHHFMQGVMNNFFDGSLTQMVSFFAKKEELSIKESEEIMAIANEIIKNKS